MTGGPDVRTPGGNRANAEHEVADAPIVTDLDADRKAFMTLRAQLALAGGHVLTELSNGSFLVNRWGQTRHCSDLHAVAQFAKRLGVKS